jgi:uncharacterized protein (DUF952 family)
MIYHITTAEWCAQFADNDTISAASLDLEGFIHCSTASQVAGVLERYFDGIDSIILLTIDENRLVAPLKYEVATNDEAFPHIYGKINRSAVVREQIFERKNNVFEIVF